MEGIIMTAQLLLGLSFLVGVHELGHLLAAKYFGMRVEKYSIGFPPKIWGKQFGETEYSFGAIPLGGFVKISGMIDESLDVKTLSEEPEPWEFRAKPAWQRLIVMMGGIIVNVFTGIIIFIFLSYSQGETFLSKEELNKNGIVAYELGEKIGFQTGDRITNINGQEYDRFRDLISPTLLLSNNAFYTVDRGGETVTIPIPSDFIDNFSAGDRQSIFISYRMAAIVGNVQEGSNAEAGGLLVGDQFVKVGGTPASYFDQVTAVLSESKGQSIEATVLRDGQEKVLSFEVTEEGTLGFYIEENQLKLSSVDYSLLEAVPVGTVQAFSVVWLNIRAFGKMFSGDVSPRKSLSGPIGIAKIFGGSWDAGNFWRITGLLSMVLAFMNFLPIPALDGGHVMFLTWEMVTGRKPSDKFLETSQKIGMVFLLALMGFVIFNDILKL